MLFYTVSWYFRCTLKYVFKRQIYIHLKVEYINIMYMYTTVNCTQYNSCPSERMSRFIMLPFLESLRKLYFKQKRFVKKGEFKLIVSIYKRFMKIGL